MRSRNTERRPPFLPASQNGLLARCLVGSECQVCWLMYLLKSSFSGDLNRCREKQRKEATRLLSVNAKLTALNKLLMEENERLTKHTSQLAIENQYLRQHSNPDRNMKPLSRRSQEQQVRSFPFHPFCSVDYRESESERESGALSEILWFGRIVPTKLKSLDTVGRHLKNLEGQCKKVQ